jgi:large subunit ribosomal protein L21
LYKVSSEIICEEIMFAIVETGSKQYRVEAGDIIKVEKLAGEVGGSIKLDKVLAVTGKVGQEAAKATVVAEIIDQRKNDKEIIFKRSVDTTIAERKGIVSRLLCSKSKKLTVNRRFTDGNEKGRW